MASSSPLQRNVSKRHKTAMLDGGLISLPLLGLALVAGLVGGAGAGCHVTTGDVFCRAPSPPLPPPACNSTVSAGWEATQSSSSPASFTLTAASSHSHEWMQAVTSLTASPAARFSLDLLGSALWVISVAKTGEIPLPIEAEAQLSARYALLSSGDTLSLSCPPGVVWQWTLHASHCGELPSAVGTRDVRCTPNVEEPPCCVPGYEAHPMKPHSGGCLTAANGMDMRLKSPACAGVKSVRLASRSETHLLLEKPSSSAPGHGVPPIVPGLLVASVGLSLMLTRQVASRGGRRLALL